MRDRVEVGINTNEEITVADAKGALENKILHLVYDHTHHSLVRYFRNSIGHVGLNGQYRSYFFHRD